MVGLLGHVVSPWLGSWCRGLLIFSFFATKLMWYCVISSADCIFVDHCFILIRYVLFLYFMISNNDLLTVILILCWFKFRIISLCFVFY
jgi:hypothetical protein